jgi:flagellar biosynthesis/type III secretory pathway protein FliH
LLQVARMSQLAETLFQEGKAKGRAEGLVEGRSEGEALAILAVLAARFGTVPADLAARLHSERDGRRRQRWVALAATCHDLREFSRSIAPDSGPLGPADTGGPAQ